MSTIDDVMELVFEYGQARIGEYLCKSAHDLKLLASARESVHNELRAAIEAMAQPRKWERLTDEEVEDAILSHDFHGSFDSHHNTAQGIQTALIRKNGGE